MEAVVGRIGGCCSTGAESKIRQLFSFGRNLFRIYASYDNVFRQLFNWNGIWSMKALLKRIGDCCFTGVKLGTVRIF
uniref:Uncharacterized protein n=1 Tax=Strongyloides stercoralis TaxID=6248 RepID=A0A0K0E5U6_STRER